MAETLHPEETVTSIVFVRHGHTQQTDRGLLYSDRAAKLTEKGRQQAEKIAVWLERENPQVLLSSTAERVKETAEIIAASCKLELEYMQSLDEQSVGEWEGLSYLEIKKTQPELYKEWCSDPVRKRPPQGESIEDLFKRVKRDLKMIIEKCRGKKIVLATHAGVIRSTLVDALAMPLDNFWRLSIPTGSLSKMDFSDNFATLQYMSLRID